MALLLVRHRRHRPLGITIIITTIIPSFELALVVRTLIPIPHDRMPTLMLAAATQCLRIYWQKSCRVILSYWKKGSDWISSCARPRPSWLTLVYLYRPSLARPLPIIITTIPLLLHMRFLMSITTIRRPIMFIRDTHMPLFIASTRTLMYNISQRRRPSPEHISTSSRPIRNSKASRRGSSSRERQ